MKKRIKAFTITELVIVMVTIIMLMGLAVPAYNSFLLLMSKEKASAHGKELYSVCVGAVDTAYSLHSTEYNGGLTNKIDVSFGGGEKTVLHYGMLSNESISGVQYDAGSGRNFDYAAGFRHYSLSNNISEQNNQKGKAYITKYMLEGLHALEKNILTVEERLRFASNTNPAGNKAYTVREYNDHVNSVSYSAGGSTYKCKQAGIVLCYGRRDNGTAEVIFTEYGDEDGYLVICVNPLWYSLVKEKMPQVKTYDSSLSDDERKNLMSQGENEPVVIVIENGYYAAMNS